MAASSTLDAPSSFANETHSSLSESSDIISLERIKPVPSPPLPGIGRGSLALPDFLRSSRRCSIVASSTFMLRIISTALRITVSSA